ncbi:hypothetical protein AGMMS49592_0460 [Endomicrobiia bacterium]|nr:hypothetical protein AGMMS49592_0460 [Endomicrobiia bacterium]
MENEMEKDLKIAGDAINEINETVRTDLAIAQKTIKEQEDCINSLQKMVDMLKKECGL